MSVYRYSSVAEMIAHLGPIDLKVYNELGKEDYIHVMEMWASVDSDKFDEWYDSMDPELAEHILEVSNEAGYIYGLYDNNKMVH